MQPEEKDLQDVLELMEPMVPEVEPDLMEPLDPAVPLEDQE